MYNRRSNTKRSQYKLAKRWWYLNQGYAIATGSPF